MLCIHSKTKVDNLINEAYDKLVLNINTKPVLIERKQVDKKIDTNIWWLI